MIRLLLRASTVLFLAALGASEGPRSQDAATVRIEVTVIEIDARSAPGPSWLRPDTTGIPLVITLASFAAHSDGGWNATPAADDAPWSIQGRLIASPVLVAALDQRAELFVGAAIPHLQPHGEDCWKAVVSEGSREGLSIGVTPGRPSSNGAAGIELSATVIREGIASRAPVPGTRLDVGAPSIALDGVRTSAPLLDGTSLLLVLPPRGRGPSIAVHLSASRQSN